MFIVCMLPADPRKRTTRGFYVGMCKGCLVDRGILTLLTGGRGRGVKKAKIMLTSYMHGPLRDTMVTRGKNISQKAPIVGSQF